MNALKKLYKAAKRLAPVLTVVLLLAQIPVAYMDLANQVTEASTMTE
jgi:hypothetical protein